MTTFLYYMYNRSRRLSVHINDDCNPSLLLFTVIFRSFSSDRTAHEKKEIQQCGVENIQAQYNSALGVSVPGSGAFLAPGYGMGKKYRVWIWDEQNGSYFRELENYFLG
jgi:hypothetical protein